MISNSTIYLYRTKPPISNLTLTRSKAFNDLLIEVHDRAVGRLHLTLEETPQLLLGVFAEVRGGEIGYIEDGEVVWLLDTTAHSIECVVDSLGNLHQARDL